MNAHSHRLFGRNRLRLAAIAMTPALALTVFTVLSATPAYAYSCPASTVCTWQNSNYGGTQWNFVATSSHPRGYWWYVGNAANDQISSIVNSHTAYKAWFDKDCPASGQYTWVGTLQKAPNLANNKWPNGSSMNDSISAWGLDSTVPAHGSRPAGGC
jgi:hypothetical protein